jgi:hypothetical protein
VKNFVALGSRPTTANVLLDPTNTARSIKQDCSECRIKATGTEDDLRVTFDRGATRNSVEWNTETGEISANVVEVGIEKQPCSVEGRVGVTRVNDKLREVNPESCEHGKSVQTPEGVIRAHVRNVGRNR